jgi:hypothetical protein
MFFVSALLLMGGAMPKLVLNIAMYGDLAGVACWAGELPNVELSKLASLRVKDAVFLWLTRFVGGLLAGGGDDSVRVRFEAGELDGGVESRGLMAEPEVNGFEAAPFSAGEAL